MKISKKTLKPQTTLLALLAALILLALVLAGPAPCLAGEVTIDFEWDQNDYDRVERWRMYVTDTQGGPYTFLVEIPKESGGPVFTSPATATAPDGQRTTLYFVLTAVDDDNNIESDYSNEVSRVIDWSPVNTPILRIRVLPSSGG